MPLPLILGIGAAIAAVGGVGASIHGGVKMKEANDTIKSAQYRHEQNIEKLKKQEEKTTENVDRLGIFELEIIKNFSIFAQLIEKIHNRPEFKNINQNNENIPTYSPEELRKASVGASGILGSLGGAAAGIAGAAGSFAIAGAGSAAINASLATLGGGAIAAGGGGIALGTAVLGGATLGVSLLVGGIIFNFTGSKLSDKADEAWSQMKKAEEEINKICDYLDELETCAKEYHATLNKLNNIYQKHIDKMKFLIVDMSMTDWKYFSDSAKLLVENTYYLVGLLYNMCKVKLVLQSENKDETNAINRDEINIMQLKAESYLLTA